MRNLRKLMLLAMMALAAMAFGASTASAQHNLEVSNEATGTHCPAVIKAPAPGTNVTGGCLIHATSEGEVELRKHVFGVESHIFSCKWEFWARLDENGEGWIFEQQLIQMPPPHRVCNREPCTVSGAAEPSESEPWKASGREIGPNTAEKEVMTVNFCISALTNHTRETCEVEVPFKQTGHATEFGGPTEIAAHGVSGFRCEIVGHWNTESAGTEMHDMQQAVNVEVHHLDDPLG